MTSLSADDAWPPTEETSMAELPPVRTLDAGCSSSSLTPMLMSSSSLSASAGIPVTCVCAAEPDGAVSSLATGDAESVAAGVLSIAGDVPPGEDASVDEAVSVDDDEEPESDGCAYAIPGAVVAAAAPTPRATANAPMRPMCLAYPMIVPFSHSRGMNAAVIK